MRGELACLLVCKGLSGNSCEQTYDSIGRCAIVVLVTASVDQAVCQRGRETVVQKGYQVFIPVE